MRRAVPIITLAALAAASWGCPTVTRHVRDVGPDADGDADADADPDVPDWEWCAVAELPGHGSNRVDLLVVMDNSGSMAEEQAVLSGQAALLLRELIDPSPGPDGSVPPSVDDIHVGVVSTDMGTGGFTIMTCSDAERGDDGVLQNVGRRAGCLPRYEADSCTRASCPWIDHSEALPDDGSDPTNAPIWEDFACTVTLGTSGCGFEQQLEASHAALVRQTRPGGPNEGFLRDDSVLVVLYVTDEDDCSASDSAVFDVTRTDLGPLNVRCAMHEELLHPVSHYRDALLSLRPGQEDLVVVAAITGVPVDGSWSPGDPIERLRALRQVNPSDPSSLLPSCETAMGSAFPPVRIAELVYMFGDNGVLESICRSDWSGALASVTRAIQRRLTGRCVPGWVPDPGDASCRVVETLPDSRPCPHPADLAGPGRTVGWHVDLGLDRAGRRACEILPADYDGDGCPDGRCTCEPPYSGCLQGWLLDRDAAPCPGARVELTSPMLRSPGAEIRFECFMEGCPAP